MNPPGNPKARFFTAGTTPEDPEAWRSSASEQPGSWWPHWLAWLEARCGERRPAPDELGSRLHPPLDPAPGRYVHDR